MARKKLYAAYGSNMNLAQMEDRCPSAKIFGKGIIRGYELEFRGFSSWGGGVATIATNPDSEVPVLLWELTEACEKSLDMYEGFPNFYGKEWLWVHLPDGRRRKCMVYVMTDGHDISPPSKYYLRGIAEGYTDAGITLAPLTEAWKNSIKISRLMSAGR